MQDVVVFADCSASFFGVMQSRVHEIWAHATAGTKEKRLRYSTSNTFATFALPNEISDTGSVALAGTEYHARRDDVMRSLGSGLTSTYNCFHDFDNRNPDIVRLREFHAEMDRAVLRAYGWDDLAERADSIFLDETNEDDHTYQGRLFWAFRLPRRSARPSPRPQRRTPRRKKSALASRPPH